MYRPVHRGLLAVASLIPTIGCEDSATDPAQVSISVSNLQSVLELGHSIRFVAVTSVGGGVTWSSSNPSVITIDQTGLAVARSLGFSDLTASIGASSIGWRMNVINQIAALKIDPAPVEVVPGDRIRLVAAAVDATGAPVTQNPEVTNALAAVTTWSVVDPDIARTSEEPGVSEITAIREGETRIEARLLSVTGEATLAVRLLEFTNLVAGGASTCALGSDSLAYCWGGGLQFLGTPGTGWWTPGYIPHRTGSRLAFVSLAAGGQHHCGLTAEGEAYCWGSNEYGALGIGSADQPTAPMPVTGGLRFTNLTAGGTHSCGVTQDARTFCWGTLHGASLEGAETRCGPSGKLATVLPCSRVPLPIGDGVGLTGLSAGGSHTCGLDAEGRAYCWGRWGSRNDSLPVLLQGNLRFIAITSGDGWSCGLTPAHEGFCWGANQDGQLGDGSTTSHDEPVPVAGGHSFTRLSASRSTLLHVMEGHTCGVTLENAAYCWGRNLSGELASSPSAPSLTPVRVSGPADFRSVHAGGSHTCALSLDGVAYCWGGNYEGQLGIPISQGGATPVLVTGQRSVP